MDSINEKPSLPEENGVITLVDENDINPYESDKVKREVNAINDISEDANAEEEK
jgi:hypothetical protein